MLKTRRFLAIANGCGGSHAGRTCRLGRADDSFRHEDSAGFVRLWGLSVERWAGTQGKLNP